VNLRRFLVLGYLGWTAAFAADGHLGAPLLDEYGRSQIGIDGAAWTTAQLPDGRLLFGFDTLVEFDGARWRSHEVPGTYALRAIDVADDGRIWIGGINEIGYLEAAGASYHYHSLVGHLPPELAASLGDVWHVFAEGRHVVWVTNQYVLRWSGSSFEWWHLPGARRLAGSRFEDEVYIGHAPQGLFRLGASGLERVVPAEALEGAGVEWIGRWLGRRALATSRALLVEQEDGFVPLAPEIDAWLQGNLLTSVVAAGPGRLYLGSLHGGILLVDAPAAGEGPPRLTRHLSVDTIYSLFHDREGSLWITSPSRVLRLFADESVTLFRPPPGLALLPQAMATWNGGVLVASETNLLQTQPRLPGAEGLLVAWPELRTHIHAMTHRADGVVLGILSGALVLRAGGEIDRLYRGGDIFAFGDDPTGATVAAEGRHLVRLEDEGKTTPLGVLPDLPTSLTVAREGTVVAGTSTRGVVAVGPAADHYGVLEDLLRPQRGMTHVGRCGEAVLAVRGEVAAWILPDGRHGALPLVAGFHPASTTASAGRFWIAGERRTSNGARRSIVYLVTAEGTGFSLKPWADEALARAGSIASIHAVDTAGEVILWVGGDQGILRVDTQRHATASPPLPPLLRLTGSSGPTHRPLELPYANNRIEIDLGWPQPGRRAALLVQTRLAEDPAAEWSEPQELTSLRLGNLQNGRYIFSARFVTPDGGVSAPSHLHFRVAPPWWRAPSTLVVSLLAALGLFYGLIKLRLRGLRRRAEHLEHLVEQRTALLTHANQAKTEFVAKMSHELRNPLNGIVASAHALETAGMASEQRELVGTMRHCAQLLDALIGDVLSFSEIEAGRIRLQPSNYDPVELAGAAVAVMRPIAAAKGLQVELAIDPATPRRIHGDHSRVQQVLLNLLGNAVKFSDQGQITLQVTVRQRQLRFQVADQGPGIPEPEREHLFEKFSRTTAARQRNIPGTGLGLAVCRQLVELMGGRIWLEASAPGAGAVFTVELPWALPASALPPAAGAAAGGLPATALVVEDLDYNLRAMVAMLERFGCTTQTATTAAAALNLIRQHRFDAIFLDCDLPDMTGPDLARSILSALPDPSLAPRLVATTAYADDASRERCLRAGMHAFIAKPVTPEKIRAALATPTGSFLAAPSIVMPDQESADRAEEGLDLRSLKTIATDSDGWQEQAARLEEMLQQDLTATEEALQAQAWSAAHSAAHRIVSHARFVGAQRLSAIAGEVQQQSLEDPEMATDLLPALVREVQRTREALAHHRQVTTVEEER
jgi:signal transduction histidine kinase/CheY-like chemotaxis protein